MYAPQAKVADGGGIPRKFAETQKCGNLKDPKSFGSKIVAAWDEAKQLAMAQTTPRFDYDFDKVHKQWLGKDWNGWGWFYDYKKIINSEHPCAFIRDFFLSCLRQAPKIYKFD